MGLSAASVVTIAAVTEAETADGEAVSPEASATTALSAASVVTIADLTEAEMAEASPLVPSPLPKTSAQGKGEFCVDATPADYVGTMEVTTSQEATRELTPAPRAFVVNRFLPATFAPWSSVLHELGDHRNAILVVQSHRQATFVARREMLERPLMRAHERMPATARSEAAAEFVRTAGALAVCTEAVVPLFAFSGVDAFVNVQPAVGDDPHRTRLVRRLKLAARVTTVMTPEEQHALDTRGALPDEAPVETIELNVRIGGDSPEGLQAEPDDTLQALWPRIEAVAGHTIASLHSTAYFGVVGRDSLEATFALEALGFRSGDEVSESEDTNGRYEGSCWA